MNVPARKQTEREWREGRGSLYINNNFAQTTIHIFIFAAPNT